MLEVSLVSHRGCELLQSWLITLVGGNPGFHGMSLGLNVHNWTEGQQSQMVICKQMLLCAWDSHVPVLAWLLCLSVKLCKTSHCPQRSSPLSCFVSKWEQSSEGPSKCKNWWKVEDELFLGNGTGQRGKGSNGELLDSSALQFISPYNVLSTNHGHHFKKNPKQTSNN